MLDNVTSTTVTPDMLGQAEQRHAWAEQIADLMVAEAAAEALDGEERVRRFCAVSLRTTGIGGLPEIPEWLYPGAMHAVLAVMALRLAELAPASAAPEGNTR